MPCAVRSHALSTGLRLPAMKLQPITMESSACAELAAEPDADAWLPEVLLLDEDELLQPTNNARAASIPTSASARSHGRANVGSISRIHLQKWSWFPAGSSSRERFRLVERRLWARRYAHPTMNISFASLTESSRLDVVHAQQVSWLMGRARCSSFPGSRAPVDAGHLIPITVAGQRGILTRFPILPGNSCRIPGHCT